LLRRFAPVAEPHAPPPVHVLPKPSTPAPVALPLKPSPPVAMDVPPPPKVAARPADAAKPAEPKPAAPLVVTDLAPVEPSFSDEPAPASHAAPPPAPLPVPSPPSRPAASLPEHLPQSLLPHRRPPSPRAEQTADAHAPAAARPRDSRRQVARNSRHAHSRHGATMETAMAELPSLNAYALVSVARRYIGTNPTTRANLWCARFMNFVLARAGYRGTGSDAALSFAHYGRRVPGPRIGAIAVMRRVGGGHVGIVSGIDRQGNPILISGNNGRYGVAETVYPRRRIIAYVMPRR
jgi:uncharacterized protein (TIGR02594 family)